MRPRPPPVIPGGSEGAAGAAEEGGRGTVLDDVQNEASPESDMACVWGYAKWAFGKVAVGSSAEDVDATRTRIRVPFASAHCLKRVISESSSLFATTAPNVKTLTVANHAISAACACVLPAVADADGAGAGGGSAVAKARSDTSSSSAQTRARSQSRLGASVNVSWKPELSATRTLARSSSEERL